MSDLSSMFSDYKTWTSQLSTLLGDAEVDKFRNKLSSINVTGLDDIRLGVDLFFNLTESKVASDCLKPEQGQYFQDEDQDSEQAELVSAVGSWPRDSREFILLRQGSEM